MKLIVTILLSLTLLLSVQSHEKSIDTDDLPSERFYFGIGNSISDLIDRLIQAIKNEINRLIQKLQEAIAKSFAKIMATLEKARSKIKLVTIKIKLHINALKHQGGAIADCAVQIETKLKELINNTNVDLDECANKYVQKLKDFENGILNNISKIQDDIDELRLSVVTCIHINPLTTAKCLIDRLNEYKNKTQEIMKSIREDVKNALITGLEAVKSVNLCQRGIIAKAIIETENLNNKLEECSALTTTTTQTTTSTTQETTTTETTTTTTEPPTTTTTTTTTTEPTTTTKAPSNKPSTTTTTKAPTTEVPTTEIPTTEVFNTEIPTIKYY